jgi:hypothetical protein
MTLVGLIATNWRSVSDEVLWVVACAWDEHTIKKITRPDSRVILTINSVRVDQLRALSKCGAT